MTAHCSRAVFGAAAPEYPFAAPAWTGCRAGPLPPAPSAAARTPPAHSLCDLVRVNDPVGQQIRDYILENTSRTVTAAFCHASINSNQQRQSARVLDRGLETV